MFLTADLNLIVDIAVVVVDVVAAAVDAAAADVDDADAAAACQSLPGVVVNVVDIAGAELVEAECHSMWWDPWLLLLLCGCCCDDAAADSDAVDIAVVDGDVNVDAAAAVVGVVLLYQGAYT